MQIYIKKFNLLGREKGMKKITVLLLITLFFISGCGNNLSAKKTITNEPDIKATSANTYSFDDEKIDESTREMEIASQTLDTRERLYHAGRACEIVGIEPKVLTSQELSDLENRQNEIDKELKEIDACIADANSGTREYLLDLLEKGTDLCNEKIVNEMLIFYNKMIIIGE